MISKELYKIVQPNEELNEELNITDVSELKLFDNDLYIDYNTEEYNCSLLINIYELAHKCKEWAKSKGFTIRVIDEMCSREPLAHRKSVSIISYDGITKIKVRDLPEPEAVFKACQWILEND